ncbi:hypothetical protein LY76DRAFT_290408 [Colletotrichum caudatum]|nr:hypothetical protein LY76DRAFT_290408 [Colletotrichum caudatum]
MHQDKEPFLRTQKGADATSQDNNKYRHCETAWCRCAGAGAISHRRGSDPNAQCTEYLPTCLPSFLSNILLCGTRTLYWNGGSTPPGFGHIHALCRLRGITSWLASRYLTKLCCSLGRSSTEQRTRQTGSLIDRLCLNLRHNFSRAVPETLSLTRRS